MHHFSWWQKWSPQGTSSVRFSKVILRMLLKEVKWWLYLPNRAINLNLLDKARLLQEWHPCDGDYHRDCVFFLDRARAPSQLTRLLSYLNIFVPWAGVVELEMIHRSIWRQESIIELLNSRWENPSSQLESARVHDYRRGTLLQQILHFLVTRLCCYQLAKNSLLLHAPATMHTFSYLFHR